MNDALFLMPTPALANMVDQIDAIDMADRDTKGDLDEYTLGKIAIAGQNGQLRTPRHIIKLMVEMTAPTESAERTWKLPAAGGDTPGTMPPINPSRKSDSCCCRGNGIPDGVWI